MRKNRNTEISDLDVLANTQNLDNNEVAARENNEDIFSDLEYICGSSSLITNSLEEGHDVAQLSNGDIIVTEVITLNILYSWDKNKQKMVKLSQS